MRPALIIAVWIGPWPWSIDLWLRSAGHNPQIDFLLISDQPAPAGLPANVRTRHRTLPQLAVTFSAVTGFPVALTSPYKLNDCKPLFWALADLGPYRRWGFADLDVVFGDLSPLLAPALDRYAMLLSEGHLRLFANTPATREAWAAIAPPGDARCVLSQPGNVGLDEHHGINRVFAAQPGSWLSDPGRVADIDPGFRQFRLLPCFANPRVQGFWWEQGRIWRECWSRDGQRTTQEFLYAHIQKRRLRVDPAALTAPAFDLTPAGVTPRPAGPPSAAATAARNPWHWPDLAELRILGREARRRLLGRPSPFARVGEWPA